MGDRPGFTLLVGPEDLLLDSLAIGAHSSVTGGANFFSPGCLSRSTKRRLRVTCNKRLIFRPGAGVGDYEK